MREIHRFESLPSTMQKAIELARKGLPSGTVVVAREQTAGQGRFGRSWHSEAGSGLYMSVLIREKICPDSLPLVTLALGLAAAETVSQFAGVAPDLRWPNDVLLEGKKCAGILVQLQDGVLIAGIGVNVNQASFPDELAGAATSLRLSTGRKHDTEALLQALTIAIDEHLANLLRYGREPVLRAFSQASSYVHGRRVRVERECGDLSGVTEGLDPQGFLVLRQDDGKRTLVLTGGVRPA